MLDVTERIFKGTIAVFTKKGLQATTQEVAKEAGVAEVTLYRRYSTKENLFNTVIKGVLEKKFHSQIMKMSKESDTTLFLTKIIEDRLTLLSKNEALIKMLLSEGLRGNLPDEINLPELIFVSLKKGLAHHFELKEQIVDSDFCARQLVGIFLGYIVLPDHDVEPYHKLPAAQKEQIAQSHAKSILAMI